MRNCGELYLPCKPLATTGKEHVSEEGCGWFLEHHCLLSALEVPSAWMASGFLGLSAALLPYFVALTPYLVLTVGPTGLPHIAGQLQFYALGAS